MSHPSLWTKVGEIRCHYEDTSWTERTYIWRRYRWREYAFEFSAHFQTMKRSLLREFILPMILTFLSLLEVCTSLITIMYWNTIFGPTQLIRVITLVQIYPIPDRGSSTSTLKSSLLWKMRSTSITTRLFCLSSFPYKKILPSTRPL